MLLGMAGVVRRLWFEVEVWGVEGEQPLGSSGEGELTCRLIEVGCRLIDNYEMSAEAVNAL